MSATCTKCNLDSFCNPPSPRCITINGQAAHRTSAQTLNIPALSFAHKYIFYVPLQACTMVLTVRCTRDITFFTMPELQIWPCRKMQTHLLHGPTRLKRD